MKGLILGAMLALALPVAAPAQVVPPSSTDVPVGAPYRIGTMDNNATVSIRDFLSSRIDQLRDELIERIAAESRRVDQLINERDRQYDQRFNAVAATFFAAQAAQAAAIDKADEADKVHFASINGLNERLESQATTLAKIDALAAVERSLLARIEDNASHLTRLEGRLTEITSRGQGLGDAWLYLGGFIALIVGVIAIVVFIRRPQVVSK